MTLLYSLVQHLNIDYGSIYKSKFGNYLQRLNFRSRALLNKQLDTASEKFNLHFREFLIRKETDF